MFRRPLLGAAVALAIWPSAALFTQDNAGDVAWRSVTELQQDIDAGKLTSKALVQEDITRIQQIDQSGPTLRAVLEVNPDALKIAEKLDAKRRPLHSPL